MFQHNKRIEDLVELETFALSVLCYYSMFAAQSKLLLITLFSYKREWVAYFQICVSNLHNNFLEQPTHLAERDKAP